MYTLYFIILAILIGIVWIFNFPSFGSLPKGNRLERIRKLSNYRNNAIENLSFTPAKADDVSYLTLLWKFFAGNPNGSPKKRLPNAQPNFSRSENLKITWFGHSSYLIQVDGKNILVDPVFGSRPSPFQFMGSKPFPGTDFISINELPEVDLLIITHDHYDHLDYRTLLGLKSRTKQYLTSLGVGAHLERWGIDKGRITELAWNEHTMLLEDFYFQSVPARHFSGRLFKRNQTLWSSFVLNTPSAKIFIGGDSGYDTHFKTIGEQFGPFDVAILECGQYDTMWPHIHLFPEQVALAAKDLKAAILIPVHWAKFKLALHDWDEPINRLLPAADKLGLVVATPKMGESFYPLQDLPSNLWWK